MSADTRTRMVAGAAEMIARRGISATSVREVVRRTGTPRGSIAHHFPGGKEQLIEEAVRFAGQLMAQRLERLMSERGVLDGMRQFVSLWRQHLEATRFEAGCPVLAVCLERHSAEDSGQEVQPAAVEQSRLLDLSNAVFADWQRIIAGALRREKVPAARARRLAALAVASVEGTVAMCRAARSAKPLDDVREELEMTFEQAIRAAAAARSG